jgi:hypothetical protein
MSSKEFMEGTQRFIGSPGGAVPVVRALATDQIARSDLFLWGLKEKKIDHGGGRCEWSGGEEGRGAGVLSQRSLHGDGDIRGRIG